MQWIRQPGGQEDVSQEAKKRTPQSCLVEGTPHEGDTCKEDEEEETQEIYVKLSAIHAIKRGILVATAHSIRGTGPIHRAIGPHALAKGARR